MKSTHALMVSVAVLGLSSEVDAQVRQRSSVIPGELRLAGGRRTPEVVRAMMVRIHARVHLCYDTALHTNTRLGGTLNVQFVIDPSGVVSSANAGPRTTIQDAAMVSCVMGTFTALRFPETPNASTMVTYSLRFVPVPAR